mmetsp:Transcript_7031/g.29880  ORF Transcript_7031/g.29880 Transcript_7031/m.29880 type:complete len:225 (+) Transcript_7031:772-1446(+)
MLNGPDLAIGDDRERHGLAHFGNALPVGRRLVAVRLGAGMHDDLLRAGGVNGTGHVQRLAGIHVTQAHLGRHHHLGRHRAAHGGHDGVDQLRLVEQHRTAAVAVHALGRAAEVQIDALGLQRRQPRGVLGQAVHVRAQQLRMHRHAGGGAAAGLELRHDAREHPRRQQLVGDADELADAAVHAADAGEHIAQDVVQQPFHRREQDHLASSCSIRYRRRSNSSWK